MTAALFLQLWNERSEALEFYEGGCQEKRFSADGAEEALFGIPPLVNMATNEVDELCRVHDLSRANVRRDEGYDKPTWGQRMPTMVLFEAQGLRLFRVVRGGLACVGGWRLRGRCLHSKMRLTLNPRTSRGGQPRPGRTGRGAVRTA